VSTTRLEVFQSVKRHFGDKPRPVRPLRVAATPQLVGRRLRMVKDHIGSPPNRRAIGC
jgi:hypothetical protein